MSAQYMKQATMLFLIWILYILVQMKGCLLLAEVINWGHLFGGYVANEGQVFHGGHTIFVFHSTQSEIAYCPLPDHYQEM